MKRPAPASPKKHWRIYSRHNRGHNRPHLKSKAGYRLLSAAPRFYHDPSSQKDFSLNATGTISQFFTNDTTAHIYVINTDGILLKLGKDGAEVTRYSDTTFTNAQSFIINETQNAAYVATTDGTLLKIDLRQ